jgi:hypothetical protein
MFVRTNGKIAVASVENFFDLLAISQLRFMPKGQQSPALS